MNITTHQVKELAATLGVDLCGIASVDRFSKAPTCFEPTDIYLNAKSALVFTKRLPEVALSLESPVPYTLVCNTVLQEMSSITYRLSITLQDRGITAVPVPSEPYEHWDEKKV